MKAGFRSLLMQLRNRHFIAIDIVLISVTPALALFLRVETPGEFLLYRTPLMIYTIVTLLWKPLLFHVAGLYRRYWPAASLDGMATVATATGLALLVEVITYAVLLFPSGWLSPNMPRSVPLISGLFTMMLVGASRFSVRFLLERSLREDVSSDARPTLIVGAGMAGTMVVRELRGTPHLALVPVGFLDDDRRKKGLIIHGVPVLGRLDELPAVAAHSGASQVIIAMPTAPGRVIRSVHQACEKAGIPDKTVPGIFEILEGSARVSQIRDVDIEDLLRRGAVRTEIEGLRPVFSGRSVMVTGAGGSIGSELCRQIAGVYPADLILLGHGENSIFGIASELRRHPAVVGGQVRLHEVIADMRERARMERVFAKHRPAMVFHAAAHKHVGLMEANVPDAVSNNVLGTRNLTELAVAYGTERFVMISSDKAVNPTSVMGVTKRIAELVVRDAAVRSGKAFVSVRFGNVLGSRGSVVPIFKAQIAQGGPVTITHPEATRYFMTIPEAVQLVLQAGTIGRGGELFVLDMGDPIRILDLARDVIRLSGLEEGVDIEIAFTGLKKGEKLHEELFYGSEIPERSSHEKIFVCQSPMQHTISHLLLGTGISGDLREMADTGGPAVSEEVDRLLAAVAAGSVDHIKECIKRLVPQYEPGLESFVNTGSANSRKHPQVQVVRTRET